MARYRAKDLDNRTGATCGLDGFLSTERHRIFDGATDERKRQMRAAERSRGVYAAWNAVCGGTREGKHVTGLRYLPDKNELLVYLDGPSWTQEMTMLREIIRGRMAREGVELAGLIFKTSRTPAPAAQHRGPRMPAGAAKSEPPQVVKRELSSAERARIDAETSRVADPKLHEALKRAMEASLEYRPVKK